MGHNYTGHNYLGRNLIAPVMHGEMLGKVDFMSTFFVFGGTVTCLYFGSRHKETYSLEEISTLASRPIFRAYVVFIFVKRLGT